MRSQVIALVTTFLLVVLPVQESKAQLGNKLRVPEPIEELASKFQGKSPDDVLNLIIERFGPAQRNIGSGLSILQWDVYGGVLTFHPLYGPAFFDPKTQKILGLMRTNNMVRENLFGDYEMALRPSQRGMRLWLGNLTLASDMTYKFTVNVKANNFFNRHPNGTIAVRYMRDITDKTLLESLGERSAIAQLTFISADGGARAIYSIASSQQGRSLRFFRNQGMPFIMDKSWENHWK